ncbi:hypothetical protein NPIL_225451 [Nephila pilipes]|uniref:Uncharacterized protein n=1 Tax=Nephila pilipes TaxID=299642 RepID=A0A8X6MQQ7_NEPPI|nr:hypothetical protein NPIL_225451 [Nephila pilipes]
MPRRDSSTEMNEPKTFLVRVLFVVIAFRAVNVCPRYYPLSTGVLDTLICPKACPTDDQGARLTEVKRSRDPILGPCGHITHSPALVSTWGINHCGPTCEM